jgi:hypothetical protein
MIGDPSTVVAGLDRQFAINIGGVAATVPRQRRSWSKAAASFRSVPLPGVARRGPASPTIRRTRRPWPPGVGVGLRPERVQQKVCDHQPNPSLRCILPSPITIVLGGLRWVSSIPHDLFSLSNFNWGTTTHISCFLPLQMLRRGRTAGLGTDWRDGLGSGLVLGHHVESLSGNVQKCVKHLSPH